MEACSSEPLFSKIRKSYLKVKKKSEKQSGCSDMTYFTLDMLQNNLEGSQSKVKSMA